MFLSRIDSVVVQAMIISMAAMAMTLAWAPVLLLKVQAIATQYLLAYDSVENSTYWGIWAGMALC